MNQCRLSLCESGAAFAERKATLGQLFSVAEVAETFGDSPMDTDRGRYKRFVVVDLAKDPWPNESAGIFGKIHYGGSARAVEFLFA